MSIDYAVYRNHLAKKGGRYVARVLSVRSASLDDIVSQLVVQGSTITREDIDTVLAGTIRVIVNMLLDGKRVNFGDLVSFSSSVRGTFRTAQESFDRSRHELVPRAAAGVCLKKAFAQQSVPKRVERRRSGAELYLYEDLATSSHNDTLTPANIGCIRGVRLSFDASAQDEGIYFVSDFDGTAIKVALVQKNKPSELIFLVPPSLCAGAYTLELRNRIRNDRLVSARLDATLIVR